MPKYKRLFPGGPECRLKGAYLITCTGCVKDENGNVTEVLCGGWYIPKSNRAKYCPECAKEEERRKTRERVRRHRAAM